MAKKKSEIEKMVGAQAKGKKIKDVKTDKAAKGDAELDTRVSKFSPVDGHS